MQSSKSNSGGRLQRKQHNFSTKDGRHIQMKRCLREASPSCNIRTITETLSQTQTVKTKRKQLRENQRYCILTGYWVKYCDHIKGRQKDREIKPSIRLVSPGAKAACTGAKASGLGVWSSRPRASTIICPLDLSLSICTIRG